MKFSTVESGSKFTKACASFSTTHFKGPGLTENTKSSLSKNINSTQKYTCKSGYVVY